MSASTASRQIIFVFHEIRIKLIRVRATHIFKSVVLKWFPVESRTTRRLPGSDRRVVRCIATKVPASRTYGAVFIEGSGFAPIFPLAGKGCLLNRGLAARPMLGITIFQTPEGCLP